MGKIKVLVLGTRGFPGVPGGVEKHCEELYPRLARMGCAVTVAARSSYIRNPQRVLEQKGVRFLYLWSPKQKHLEALVHTFSGLIRGRLCSPDIVHFHGIGPSLLVPLARLMGLKVVVTHHGPDYRRKKWNGFARFFLKTGEWSALKFADAVIVVAGWIAGDLAEKYGRIKKIHVIPNGIEPVRLVSPGETLKKYGLEPGKYFFTAGRFVPEKGLVDLITAYRKIKNNGLKLVIAGGADHRDGHSRRIEKMGRETTGVVLTGKMSGNPLSELYSNAGLFVLPSYYEGLSLALLEAMSYGIPVLASDIRANREVALPEIRFFPAGDVEMLSRKMTELLARGITDAEKSSGRDAITRNYNWDKIAGDTLLVYKKAMW
ncbi:MAG: glycosyltransferase family 4 protein [Candidatus Ratteibacteria bacterium]